MFTSVIGLRRFSAPLFFAAALCYLTFHALSGERGIYALIKDRHHLEALKLELAQTHSERDQLERKVKHLRPDAIDLDLLDEQSRLILGTAGSNEVMIVVEEKQN